MSSIDPAVAGRDDSVSVPAKIPKNLVVKDDEVTAWLKSFGPIRPFAVPICDAQQILGRKARSQIYEAIGRGELEAVKDGAKTLIVVASIVRYCGRMQPAQIKAPPSTKKVWPRPKAAANRSRETRALNKPEEAP